MHCWPLPVRVASGPWYVCHAGKTKSRPLRPALSWFSHHYQRFQLALSFLAPQRTVRNSAFNLLSDLFNTAKLLCQVKQQETWRVWLLLNSEHVTWNLLPAAVQGVHCCSKSCGPWCPSGIYCRSGRKQGRGGRMPHLFVWLCAAISHHSKSINMWINAILLPNKHFNCLLFFS